jgi:hypothetical protein
MAWLGFYRRAAVAAVLAAGAVAFAAATPARASAISDSPTLPLLGVPYVTANSDACFLAPVNVCVTGGAITLTAPVSSVFDATGQDITTGAVFSATLTTLSHVPILPILLSGTVEQEVVGRTFSTEIGSWTTNLISLSLSGPVLGHTLTVGLDPAHDSTGVTSITPIASNGLNLFRIDSFFDVFIELSLDTVPPLSTTREITAEAVQAVPEPSSLAAIAIALPMMLVIWRRRGTAVPMTRVI